MFDERIRPHMQRIAGNAELAYSVQKLVGDASSREYFRVTLQDGASPERVIVMSFNPEGLLKSDEGVTGNAPAEFPFSNVQNHLAAAGLPVPEIYHQALDEGLVFLEDLGDVQFVARVRDADHETRLTWYRRAIDLLLDFQDYGQRGPDPGCVAFSRHFDHALLMWEFEHYLEYGIEAQFDRPIPREDREFFHAAFAAICRELEEAPQLLAHRDFQSRNIMLAPRGLVLIDFQDALVAPMPYDLVALLRDSYVALSPQQVESLIAYYLEKRRERFGDAPDTATFTRWFRLQTVQRKLKDAGRFVFIDRVKKNPSFLQHIPNSLAHAAHALHALPDLAPLVERLGRYDERLLP